MGNTLYVICGVRTTIGYLNNLGVDLGDYDDIIDVEHGFGICVDWQQGTVCIGYVYVKYDGEHNVIDGVRYIDPLVHFGIVDGIKEKIGVGFSINDVQTMLFSVYS